MSGDEGRRMRPAKDASVETQADWSRAWSGRYGRPASRGLRPRGQSPAKLAVLFGAVLGLLIAPLAIAQGGGGSDGGADAKASATGDVLREGIRNPRRGAARRETQVISGVRGERYGTRQSNLTTGDTAGGAAIYGCRRPTRECTRHVNLAGGPAAHFSAQGLGAVPFTIDPGAGGMVESLNAERVGGLTATQLAAQPSPPTGPAGGDLTGNYPDPTIAANAVNTSKLDNAAVRAANLGPITEVPASSPLNIGTAAAAIATCPAGTRLISGGGFVPAAQSRALTGTFRVGNSWAAIGRNDGAANTTINARAICLQQ